MNIKDYFGDWIKVIDKQELLKVINNITNISKSTVICPNMSDIFKAFNICDYNNLKVVMIGQDPYPQYGVATGILFGNKSSTPENKLSPSLQVIKEAVINYELPHNCINFDNTLESWAKQGILMLNSALTVEINKVGSHTMIWRPFIICLLKHLSEKCPGLVYVLFGEQASTFESYINKNSNTIIKVKHPAYYARNKEKLPYSLFVDINNLINNKFNYNIEWFNSI